MKFTFNVLLFWFSLDLNLSEKLTVSIGWSGALQLSDNSVYKSNLCYNSLT